MSAARGARTVACVALPLDLAGAREIVAAQRRSSADGGSLAIAYLAEDAVPAADAQASLSADLAWLGIVHEPQTIAAAGPDAPAGPDCPEAPGGAPAAGSPAIDELRRAGYMGGAVGAYIEAGLARADSGRPDVQADRAALRAANGAALRALPAAELARTLMAAMQRASLLEDPIPAAARSWVATFIEAYGDTFATFGEALALVAALRREAVVVPALELERLRNRQVIFFLDAVGQYVDAQPELRGLPLGHDLAVIAGEFGIASPDAMGAVRMALSGQLDGPALELLFPLLGHDRILIRIGAISSHLLHGRGLEPIRFGPGGVAFSTIAGERPDSA